MATVIDLSGNKPYNLPGGIDVPLSKPNRTNAGTPSGVLTPLYGGEMVLDTVSNQIYMATGVANTNWTPIVMEV